MGEVFCKIIIRQGAPQVEELLLEKSEEEVLIIAEGASW